MEAAPRDMDIDAVKQLILEQGGVVAVHDLHVWTITSGRTLLSAHVVGRDDADRDRLILAVNRALRERFGVGHTTLQVEGESQLDFSGQRSDEACDPCTAPEDQEARPAADPRGRSLRS
jgi:divalent metal cation (Fe/Co/Zn/Cd) transporter